jgi:hypothetical protein
LAAEGFDEDFFGHGAAVRGVYPEAGKGLSKKGTGLTVPFCVSGDRYY